MKYDVISIRMHDHTAVAGPEGLVNLKPTLDKKQYPGIKMSWTQGEDVILVEQGGVLIAIPLTNCENFVLSRAEEKAKK